MNMEKIHSYNQELFNYLSDELSCIAINEQMDDIKRIAVKSIWKEPDIENLPTCKVIAQDNDGNTALGTLYVDESGICCLGVTGIVRFLSMDSLF